MLAHRQGTDVDLAAEAGDAEPRMAWSLWVKGFCTVDPHFEAGVMEAAVEAARVADFRRVNEVVAEGLLGQEGSAFVADRGSTAALATVDAAMTDLGQRLVPFCSEGVRFSHRSAAVLHKVGDPADETPPLNETEVSRWQPEFLRQRLMCIAFLGPESGTLELQPYGLEGAEPHWLPTRPGLVVLVRADALAHRHSALGEAFALSSFFLTGPGRRSGAWHLVPAAQAIEQWSLERLWLLKTTELGSEPGVPESWLRAMRRAWHEGPLGGIAGVGTHQTASYDAEEWFAAASAAPDYVTEVPITRWDHSTVYDADPESCWPGKTSCRHGSVMEGIEMFDNTCFGVSYEEAKTLDPHQRLLLEQGYRALVHMGMDKSKLANSAGAVYVGCESDEWTFRADQPGLFSINNMPCMFSGRLSFSLGLKGPSVTLAVGGASGLSAVCVASEYVRGRGPVRRDSFAVAAGASLLLSPLSWPSHSMSGWLSKEGRCMTFDASASGYVRGDGCTATALRTSSQLERAEGEPARPELLGACAGAALGHGGPAAGLTAPSGPAEQERVAAAVRDAQLQPGDVGLVEANGLALLLRDAVEASSQRRALRSDDGGEPLALLSAKSSVGNQVEASGLSALLRVVFAARHGCIPPGLHLHRLNPNIEPGWQLMLPAEAVDSPGWSSYSGVMAQSLSGASAFVVAWGALAAPAALEPEPAPAQSIGFWPGGGGQSVEAEAPREPGGYFLVGTWSRWERPERMRAEGDGDFVLPVALGENGWEQFQIWLDGDPARALHPGDFAMPPCPALGPDPELPAGVEALRAGLAPTWLLDGQAAAEGAGAGSDEPAEPGGPDQALAPVKEPRAWGRPGDRFLVRLQVRGRWRLVTWEPLPESADGPAPAPGTYQITGSWNDWALEEMRSDPSTPGLFTSTVEVPSEGYVDFQIVRDLDWGQMLYPDPESPTTEPSGILGPDNLGWDLAWRINGKPGDMFRVQFYRTQENGTESRSLSWQHRETPHTDG